MSHCGYHFKNAKWKWNLLSISPKRDREYSTVRNFLSILIIRSLILQPWAERDVFVVTIQTSEQHHFKRQINGGFQQCS